MRKEEGFLKKILNKKVSIILIALITIFLTYFIFEMVSEKKVYNATIDYLTIEKGYKENEIQSIDVEFSLMNKILSYQQFVISVVFNDETDVTYFFGYNKGDVSPQGHTGHTGDAKSETYINLPKIMVNENK